MNEHERQAWMLAEFNQSYAGRPTHWTRAPGRVDLMGSHTDYNEGFILTMAIDRDTWLAARPRTDRCVRVRSLNVPGETTFALDAIEHDPVIPWTNYLRGVAQELEATGHRLVGFDGLVHTTVPVASGLSSSAALEMATARMFEAVSGTSDRPGDIGQVWPAGGESLRGRQLRYPRPVHVGSGQSRLCPVARCPQRDQPRHPACSRYPDCRL